MVDRESGRPDAGLSGEGQCPDFDHRRGDRFSDGSFGKEGLADACGGVMYDLSLPQF